MAARNHSHSRPGREEIRDLGFGESVARDSLVRLLNRDGTFNTSRHGLSVLRSIPVYEHLVTMGWGRFYLLVIAGYLIVDVVFAAGYLALGPSALHGMAATSGWARFAEAFFFSIHTITTVGYGSISPATSAANLLVAMEALVGLGGFAVMAALLFARMARPTADIRFSERGVIAPYDDGRAFMFRIANGSRSELVDASVRVIFSWIEGAGSERRRHFETLDLERGHVAFFPLHWTVVHPIDERSPLNGWTAARLEGSRAEFLIQVSATTETYFEVVRARSSYLSDEVVWGARFSNILEETDHGAARVDIRRIGELEPAAV